LAEEYDDRRATFSGHERTFGADDARRAGTILTYLRYVDIEVTFDAICELFPDAQTDEERMLGVTERLARHDLEVWKQAGPYVQTVLVQKIRKIDKTKVDPFRPVLLEVLGEALKAEVFATCTSKSCRAKRDGLRQSISTPMRGAL
jgi:hypothetical protein